MEDVNTRMSLYEEIEESAERVFEELGSGLSERAYHNAMETELSHRGVEFSSESNFSIMYRGKPIAYRRPDLVVGHNDDVLIIVELKAGSKAGMEQLRSYLNLGAEDANLDVDGGMLICFNGEGIETRTEKF
ncbi:PD-(D/E)XK nuclease [Halogranum tailed virus 1]|uniref:PD-(D/E)XK nuclease n=1 Tax=Halogranum tailed virus 1 TaxID=1273749 RepID=R4TGU4_9CAUD|nr:PD-(D/E)XK nuclease [Halogranum tailed virus 1]AGM11486.1 PD-(D/E)XK nuclease [Halogranum tailed virus 1]